jgi:hypothetical protein
MWDARVCSRALPLLAALLLSSLAGCGENHRQLMEEMNGVQSRVAGTLKGIDTVDDALQAVTTIENLAARWNLIALRARALGNPSEAEIKSVDVKTLAGHLKVIKAEKDRLRKNHEIWAVLEVPLQKYDAAMADPGKVSGADAG